MQAQPYHPTVDGEICVYRSPQSEKVWLADQAAYDARGALRWAALDADDTAAIAAIGAHVRCKEILAAGASQPSIRNSTICKWAANIAGRMAAECQANAVIEAPLVAINLTVGSGAMAFLQAIRLQLEPEIERMLTIATRQGISGVIPSLSDLRLGLDPSGAMFTQVEQIRAIQRQYPALESDHEMTLVDHDEQPEASRATCGIRIKFHPDRAVFPDLPRRGAALKYHPYRRYHRALSSLFDEVARTFGKRMKLYCYG